MKVGAHFSGRSIRLPHAIGIERHREGLAEISRDQSIHALSGMKGRICHEAEIDFLTPLSRCLKRGP